MQSRCSVRQQATDRTGCQKLVRDAAEDPFTQSTMSVAAGHDQIGALITNKVKELGGDRPPRLPPYFARHDNSMAAKVARHIGKMSFVVFRSAFLHSEDQILPPPTHIQHSIARP